MSNFDWASFDKLKECNAYIDNELPDYIMVMLVNKKTFHQISNDLQLFLGDDTSNFIDWLQEAVDNGGTVPVKTKTSSEPNEKEGEHARTKSDSKTDDAGREETAHISEDSPGESGSKRSGSKQRSKSEDELELHPALDWEEEREGGRRGEGGRGKPSKHRGGGVSEGKSARKGSGEVKVARATEGEREEREEGKERKKRGEGLWREGGRWKKILMSPLSNQLAPSKVLIARKKGERSAPPTYLSGRRYSHSGSEGEEGEEEEEEFERGRGREGGRRGGLSSVVKYRKGRGGGGEGGRRGRGRVEEEGSWPELVTESERQEKRTVELAVITALRKVLPGQKELTDLRQLINQQRESPKPPPTPQCHQETTGDVPHCKYGNKCLFIHPQCKFDSSLVATHKGVPGLMPISHTAPRHVLPRAASATGSTLCPPAFPPAMMKVPAPVKSMWSPRTKSQ
ncbi:Zinc finger CCCH domain-containing protein 14 [Geodia barretti]|uniref:Zinc finger CCCH domain-containing protein 14 n=1 Tax=Geodia barretti TaxID=519541 RepID=A0AA35T1L2_GEOBA|nr:Zinc finger CCCH domain-containing protein 14 [Geodia barretti]